MTEPDDQKPSGVLVIDGDALLLAHTADDVREVDHQDLASGAVVPEAALVRTMTAPRLQRTGAQAVAMRALEDLPFYAVAARCEEAALDAAERLKTPLDRIIHVGADGGRGTISVADDDTGTLLAAVFADLPANLPPADARVTGSDATARLRAKWYFGDVRRELAALIGPLARRNARANRPLRLAHYRCGEGTWAFAIDPAIHYVGIDDRPACREAAATRLPDATILAPDALAGGSLDEVGVFLLTDVLDTADPAAAIEALRPLATLRAREAMVIGLAPHGASGATHGVIDEPRVSALGLALSRTFGGTCELRRLATVAYKPFDALPGTTLVAFEVSR